MNKSSLQMQEVELHQFLRIVNLGSFSQKKLSFEPANSLAFPARQIKSLKQDHDREVVELTCLSLYGVSSPLPHYFITDALSDENAALRSFLSIFNQQIFRSYFYAWEHKHPELFQDKALNTHAMICDLSASAVKITEPIPGLATQFFYQNKTLFGLNALVKLLYPDLPFQVRRKDCEWIDNHLPARLGEYGSTSRLNDGFVLGKRVACASHRIEIVLGPSPVSLISQNRKIYWLRRYLSSALKLDLVWLIDPNDASHQLSNKMQLGLTSTLGPRIKPMKKVIHV